MEILDCVKFLDEDLPVAGEGTVVTLDRRTAVERVRDRLKELADTRGHGFRNEIATRMGLANATVTPWFKGERDPSLDQLDRLCQIAGLRLPELIAPEGTLYELDADEGLIIRALRKWPSSVKRALVAFLQFFANEEPVAGQSRQMWELWRQMDARSRSAVFGFALQKTEGMIPLELLAQLFEGLTDETRAELEKQTKRRRRSS